MSSLQGTDNSIQSGIVAADAIVKEWNAIQEGCLLHEYENKLKRYSFMKELHRTRSLRTMFEKGLFAGMVYAVGNRRVYDFQFFSSTLCFNHNLFTHPISKGEDWEKTKSAEICKKLPNRDYEKPDGVVNRLGFVINRLYRLIE